MSAITLVAVACFLAVGVNAGGKTVKEHVASIVLEQKHVDETFAYLDTNKDGKIKRAELEKFFYHGESKFAVGKFISLIDGPDDDSDVDSGELSKFMHRKPVTLAVHECVLYKSKTIRQLCFADQVLTYVYLVLDKTTIDNFFNAIECPTDKDNEITKDEIVALKKWDSEFQDDDVDNLLEEIGGVDAKITVAEFTDYVIQEDILDDFRECWNKDESIKDDAQKGKYPCMIKKLLHATMDHYTELDTAAVFNHFDVNGNGHIEVSDVKALPNCKAHWPERFIKLMDHCGDGKVSYSEFRIYTRAHYVKTELERACTSKPSQAEELKCYPGKLLELVGDNHFPIWLQVPDVDMLFTFEQLDKDDDGIIQEKDLVDLGFPADLAKKVIEEIDGPDHGKDINLEEYNEYVDEPNMVYGMADCLSKAVDVRVACYIDEFKDIIKDILTIAEVNKLFEFYDTDGNHVITKEDLSKKITGEDLTNFLNEMGMGDQTITRREFTWYVRQQDLSDLLKVCTDLKTLHKAILDYQELKFTQYDTQQLFAELDTNHNQELTEADFKGVDKVKVKVVLSKMDHPGDANEIVNFVEYWLFFHAPEGKNNKEQLEKKCTEKHENQADEIKCYKTALFEICGV